MESNWKPVTRRDWSRSMPSPASPPPIRARKKFVEELWNTPPPDGLERYYEGLLYMMALLHCGGEFRVW